MSNNICGCIICYATLRLSPQVHFKNDVQIVNHGINSGCVSLSQRAFTLSRSTQGFFNTRLLHIFKLVCFF